MNNWSRRSVLSVKAEHIATFLGHKIVPRLAPGSAPGSPRGSKGTCIKHRFGNASVKMCDKFERVLRIETTTNDVSFFKHHRKVEHRQGPATRAFAPVKESIYRPDRSARDFVCLQPPLPVASFHPPATSPASVRALDRLTRPRKINDKNGEEINFFGPVAEQRTAPRVTGPTSEYSGVRRADLLPLLDHLSPDRLSRQLRRLRDVGVIKRAGSRFIATTSPDWGELPRPHSAGSPKA